jgi:oxygen-independent coproporphyrinogen-3 oxidase
VLAAGRTPLSEETNVSRRELPFEFMLNALRLADGVPASLFAERTGLPISAAARAIADATRKGLLEPDPTILKPTPLGRRFLNDLQALFLAESPRDPTRAMPRRAVPADAVRGRAARP